MKENCIKKDVIEKRIQIGHPAWVLFLLYVILILLVESVDLACYLAGWKQTTILSRVLVILLFGFLIFLLRKKVSFSIQKKNRSTPIIIVGLLIWGFFKGVIPDTSCDVQNYHLIAQTPGFVDGFGYHIGLGDFQLFGFRLPDRMFYLFRFILGYRMGTILNTLVIILIFLQVRDLLAAMLNKHFNLLKEQFESRNRFIKITGIVFCNEALLALVIILTHDLTMQFGSYMVDLFAIPIMLEMLRVLLMPQSEQNGAHIYFAFLAGLVFCMKMTNVVYIIPLLIIYLAKNYKNIKAPWFFACFGVAIVPVSVYLIYNFAETGNPVFPYFNEIFKSEYFPLYNFKDTRWGNANFGDYMLWPIYMIFRPHYRQSEISNPWAIGGLGILVATACFIVRCIMYAVKKQSKKIGASCDLIYIVFIISYLAWAYTTGHIRYFTFGYILGGMMLIHTIFEVILLSWMWRSKAKKWIIRVTAIAMGCVFAIGPMVYLRNNILGREWAWREVTGTALSKNIQHVFRDHQLASQEQSASIDVFLLNGSQRGSVAFAINDQIPIISNMYVNGRLSEEQKRIAQRRIAQYFSEGLHICDIYFTDDTPFDSYIDQMNEYGIKLESCEWIEGPWAPPDDFFLLDLGLLAEGETNRIYQANSSSKNSLSLQKTDQMLAIDLFAGYISNLGWYPTDGISLQITIVDNEGHQIVRQTEVRETEFYSLAYEEDISSFSSDITIRFDLVNSDGSLFDVDGGNRFIIINPEIMGARIEK